MNIIDGLFKNDQIVLNNYTIKDLRKLKSINLNIPLNNKDINNLIYINPKCNIQLKIDPNTIYDEITYYENLLKVITAFSKLNRDYTIDVSVYNRELFRQSGVLKNIPKNINLNITSGDSRYSIKEYQKEENKIESLITQIRIANMSPFEKYIAVYDIVKNYKAYKDNKTTPYQAIYLKNILSDDNDYIICGGYARLLTELLNRVNIPSKYIFVYVDTSLDKESKRSDILNMEKHVRNLVKIDDNKYNIHGFYLADSTWDNEKDYNLYTNCLLTFDRKKEAKRLESLEDEDLLLDFHNNEEFNEKIKYFIKKHISYPKIDASLEEILRKKAYRSIYLQITDILKYTDIEMYKKLYDKYDSLLNIDLNEIDSHTLEPILTNLLTDYAKYIIPLVNKEIPKEAYLKALITTQKELYYKSDEEIKEWLKKTIDVNAKMEDIRFPYKYNPNNKTEAYLEERENKAKK